MNSCKRFGAPILAAGMVLVGVSAPMALADSVFDFTFSSNGPDVISGSGTLDAVANGDGSYTAISGSGTVEVQAVSNPDGFSASDFVLHANPNGTGQATSPSGAFYYDNQLFPDSAVSVIDNNGLLFTGSAGSPSTPFEINIYSNGNPAGTPYDYMEYTNGSYIGYVGGASTEQVIFSMVDPPSPVPLPAAAGVGFSLLGGFGGLAALRKRYRRSLPIA